jgi:mono/diheme cytochrome c family protein
VDIRTILKVSFSLFFTVVISGVLYLRLAYPKFRVAAAETIEPTEERVARGKYLAESVLNCYGCHSVRDYGFYSGPTRPETQGQGAECFDEKVGFPGKVCAQNITPALETGLGAWTDGEIIRAIREGVSRDGRALFPMMPYKMLRQLSDEDAQAVVAYLRQIPPIEKQTPEGYVKFPVSLFIRTQPQPLDGPVPSIDHHDAVAYGKYLAEVAGCIDCHSPIDTQMKSTKERVAGGGRIFIGDFGTVVSPNLTTDPTGLGTRSKKEFIGLFKSFNNEEIKRVAVPKGAHNTIMPWFAYAQMTEADLGAIYEYLQTLPKIENLVTKWPVPNASK